MFASTPDAPAGNRAVSSAASRCKIQVPPLLVTPAGTSPDGTPHSLVRSGGLARMVAILEPARGGGFAAQAEEVANHLRELLANHGPGLSLTNLTVFLRRQEHFADCRRLFEKRFPLPVINYVWQPPCCGAEIAVEAWSIWGDSVRVRRLGPYAVETVYDGLRWIHCGGVATAGPTAYASAVQALRQMRVALEQAGSSLGEVVRTWFFLGSITDREGESQRYQELNRARTECYRDVIFCSALGAANIPQGIFPASTGIGMNGAGLAASCLSLATDRQDVSLVMLENPQQTPAYAYHPRYSPQSPKFSRAIAVVLGDYVTTWISGTASITHSESRHLGDIEKQTHQTIDNIEHLISRQNFSFHGIPGGGAKLSDLAKIRVYVKHQGDYLKCKAICESRFGQVPALYATADICRPELLVEIEGVAFSPNQSAPR